MKRSLFVISLITVLAVGLALAQGTPPQRGGGMAAAAGRNRTDCRSGQRADRCHQQRRCDVL